MSELDDAYRTASERAAADIETPFDRQPREHRSTLRQLELRLASDIDRVLRSLKHARFRGARRDTALPSFRRYWVIFTGSSQRAALALTAQGRLPWVVSGAPCTTTHLGPGSPATSSFAKGWQRSSQNTPCRSCRSSPGKVVGAARPRGPHHSPHADGRGRGSVSTAWDRPARSGGVVSWPRADVLRPGAWRPSGPSRLGTPRSWPLALHGSRRPCRAITTVLRPAGEGAERGRARRTTPRRAFGARGRSGSCQRRRRASRGPRADTVPLARLG
jgi:hypothetical protein